MGNGNTSRIKIKVQNLPLDIELCTSASIIYLIGKNGAGKSRFIDGLKDSKAQITIGPDTSNKRAVPFRYLTWDKLDYNKIEEVKTKFKNINKTLKECDQSSVVMDKRENEGKEEFIDGEWRRNNEIRYQPTLNEIDFEGISHLSEGTKKHYEMFNWTIGHGLKGPKFPENHGNSQPHYIVVGIEEPENSLHPKIQKDLPKLLNKWILNQQISQAILIVVSTHSPFIIKGASEFASSQRIYGLNECKLVDLTGKKEETNAKEGVSGSQSIIVANELLGSGIGDFFPNPILLSENSVHELLEGLSKSTKEPINDFLVGAGGDGNIEQRIGNLQQMAKILKQMHKSFPERNLFKFKVIIIADDKSKEEAWKKGFENLHDFEIETHGLGENKLEDIYPQKLITDFIKLNYPNANAWDKAGLINEYITNELSLKGKEKGKFKKDLALFISSKMKNLNDIDKQLNPVGELLRKIKLI